MDTQEVKGKGRKTFKFTMMVQTVSHLLGLGISKYSPCNIHNTVENQFPRQLEYQIDGLGVCHVQGNTSNHGIAIIEPDKNYFELTLEYDGDQLTTEKNIQMVILSLPNYTPLQGPSPFLSPFKNFTGFIVNPNPCGEYQTTSTAKILKILPPTYTLGAAINCCCVIF